MTLATIQIRRGAYANLPVLADGEIGFTEDKAALWIGSAAAGANVKVTARWAGPYSPSSVYDPYDLVTYAGGLYICVVTSSGNVPTNGACWAVLAPPLAGLLRRQKDCFAVSGDAYTLSQTPNGVLTDIYFDGVLQADSTYTYTGSALTIAGTVNLALVSQICFAYTW
jgi:hypothetical protein